MKHLAKFEELDYSTYMRAADKISSYGQTARAKELRDHAKDMARKVVDNMTFNILVGGTRTFPDARITKIDVFKTSGSWILSAVFESESNTHMVTCYLENSGEIHWKDNNKFADRKSAMTFQNALMSLSNSNDDFQRYLSENSLTPENLRVVLRTFYV